MKKIKEKMLAASLTVEISYLIPIIISIIFAIMTVSFYFYDLVAAQAVLDKNAARLQNSFIHSYEDDTYFYDYTAISRQNLYFFKSPSLQESKLEEVKKEMSSSLIFLYADNISITLKNKKVIVSAELSFNKKLLLGLQYIPFLKRTKKITSKLMVYHPADFARILGNKKEDLGKNDSGL